MAYQPKSYRKFVATAATATLVASAIAPVAGAASNFSDVAPKYKDAVDYLVNNNITQGTSATTFGTHDNIKRGDLAIWLAKALKLDTASAPASGFEDTAGTRYDAAVSVLKAKGIVSGKSETSYAPSAFVTRGEMAIMLSRAYELSTDEKAPFTDMGAYAPYINGLYAYEITTGKTAETFGTALNITRGDLAIFLKRAAEVVKETKVESAKALNLKTVEVTFNNNVDADSAENPANYTFASGSGLTVTSAKLDGKKVVLTVNNADSHAAQQQSADLTINGVKDAKGVAIGKTTKAVKFLDTDAPVVSGIEVTGPKTIKVKFSELLEVAPNFSVNDGTLAIVSSTFVPGSDSVTLTLGAQPVDGTHKVTVENGSDYAGFKVEKTTKEFVFGKDTTAPVATVKSASPNKIVLLFSEDVANVADANVNFYHTYKGVNAYKAEKSLSGRELTLTFANPLPEGAFKLYLDYTNDNGTKIADLWGNKLEETTFAGSVTIDAVAPTVTKVEVSENTAVKVTYSEEVTGADVLANYSLKDAAGNAVALSGTITKSGNTYTIPTPALNGGSYTLTVKNVKDTSISQNKLADYTTTVTVKDIVPPTVADLDTTAAGTQAQLLSDKKVKIGFSEVMDKASIENKLNYLFNGVALDSKVKVTSVDGNKAVLLDFSDVTGDQAAPAGDTISVLRVLDAAGNPITATSTEVLVPATKSAPLFDKAEVTGKNTVKLYFKEVITNAKADDFEVDNGDGTFEGVTSVTNEVLDGKSVITLTTASDLPTSAAGVKVKTVGTVDAENSYGAAVALSNVTAGDKYAPVATEARAYDSDADTHVDRFVVTFSENLYVPSVQDSDFTIEGYEVTSVTVSGAAVTLNVKEKDVNDLAATPKVTLVGQVEDTARNVRNTQAALTAVKAAQ
ncbi:S-layer homology domain-containing protein [Mesobacillus subterraneus]|uniref:S-layer homology domain-containing protein n=1 Tax=Mesobacillus subterraneus TaxID=285983 RepID=UPI00203ED29A|nr:S-layer homology domain-containing protein [Mesobacillus subterraneus]MCM3574423.1 S-layer homology domain-containing protein [Mesobacillus subterraneus]